MFASLIRQSSYGSNQSCTWRSTGWSWQWKVCYYISWYKLCIYLYFLRLQEALKIFPHVYVEMSPGDALFFHCNLLHSSDQNNSDQRRWVMITSYNKKKNNPVLQHHHPFYHPLHMVANKAILECKTKSSVDKAFLDPNRDYSHQN